MTEYRLMGAMREAAALGFDVAVQLMRYEDGTPVELVAVVNPFRDLETPTSGLPDD